MPNSPDVAATIAAALSRILSPGQVSELRALRVPTESGSCTVSGFFDDVTAMSRAAAALTQRGATGVYFTPNCVSWELLGRSPNKVQIAQRGGLTTDADVVEVNWLLIDLDYERPSKTCTTDAEKLVTQNILRKIISHLQSEGWPTPLVGDSGNGYHLMYRIEHDNRELVKPVLDALSFMFSTPEVTVDTSVGNPSRIWKLYGTLARKGVDTALRPWRQARLCDQAGGILPVGRELMEKLIAAVPMEGEKPANGGSDSTALTLWLHKHFPDLPDATPWKGKGKRWVFEVCPWDKGHTDKSAYVAQFYDGGIIAGCLHENCKGAQRGQTGRHLGWSRLQTLVGDPFDGGASVVPLAGSTAASPNLTQLGNAKRFVSLNVTEVAYCSDREHWLTYTGKKWSRDNTGDLARRAKATVASIFAEAEAETDTAKKRRIRKHALASESRSAIDAIIHLSKSEPEVVTSAKRLDGDPWAFNVQNGTLDLRTGKLQEHDRTDFITKISPVTYDEKAACPQWDAFIKFVMEDDQEVIDFLYRYWGYCLTGDISAQSLVFMEGNGGNGKSAFLGAMLHIMGDYGIQGADGLLLEKRWETHPTELADLEGVRFVSTTEPDKGKHFAESLIKKLTGGEPVRARRMREDFYQFPATHKISVAANHKPIIKGNDDGIWRRIIRVPWRVKIPLSMREDFTVVSARFQQEAPGILNRLIEGCLAWQQQGLQLPDSLVEATLEYRDEMDLLAEFIAETLSQHPVKDADAKIGQKQLYQLYLSWCDEIRQRPSNYRFFNKQLRERGFKTKLFRYTTASGKENKPTRCWIGVRATMELVGGFSMKGRSLVG